MEDQQVPEAGGQSVELRVREKGQQAVQGPSSTFKLLLLLTDMWKGHPASGPTSPTPVTPHRGPSSLSGINSRGVVCILLPLFLAKRLKILS